MPAEETQVAETTKVEVDTVKVADGEVDAKKGAEAKDAIPVVTKNSSFKEESNFLSDLKEFEKKALFELRSKLEEAILENKLFKKEESKKEEKKVDEKPAESEEKEQAAQEETPEKEKYVAEAKEEKKPDVGTEEKAVEANKDLSLWGVPLLPSKGAEGTDVILLKFLRARDFKVNDAFVMLKNTLQWRKELNIDFILDEDLGLDLNSVAYMDGVDRRGHPICYNIYGVFQNEELYKKTFGTEEKRNQFLRWRFQLMEKGIQKLDFKPNGVSSLLQITDLKNSPGPSKKELKIATKQAVGLLQDNYPEFVAKNIFINVPFWYCAFNAILSPFFTQRTKSKFVFVRPSKVAETLLKYIPAENIPVQYGGLKRENDSEFNTENGSVSELIVKSGGTETIEIPVQEVGSTALWDLSVLGWEVIYKEEFVPEDQGSYTVIIQKSKKIAANEEPVRNSFRNNEPGKVVLTIENTSYKKKKILYRHKTQRSC